jgi:sialate O-acetylesterase
VNLISKIFLFSIFGFTQVTADIKLPAIFSDNMVLQRNKPVIIWGTASPDERVVVKFNGAERETPVNENGKWMIELPAMNSGGPYSLTVSGKNIVTINNVMVGEVWVCSGQSNMELTVAKAANAAEEISKADFRKIRLFFVQHATSETLRTDCKGEWKESSSASVENFSAAGYYFGRELFKELNVPIGLIQATWGGTAAETWVSKELLESDSDYKPILDKWIDEVAKYPEAIKEYEKNKDSLNEEWKADAKRAAEEGRREPRKPQKPRGPGSQHTPSGLYNAMLNPIIPYTMQGVIWYQGEANASRAYQYRKLFPALIKEWREKWGLGDFPFYYVQLPNLYTKPEPAKTGWPELREAQLMTLNVPNTGMAVTIDIGEAKNLHPLNKQDVGYRLALIAEAKVYGKKSLVYSGPLYKSMKIEASKIILKFEYADEGLLSKGGDTLKGFTIGQDDKKFHPANAVIKGNEILVWNDGVKNPVSVRYAWSDNPDCNLYNKAMLPASPFRTDEWPEYTLNRK